MDIFSLLERQNLQIKTIIDLINRKQFSLLYNEYREVIEQLLFITSREEFDDFIEEQESLEIKPFLLAYASNEKACCAIGMYEKNADIALKQYANVDEKIVLCNDYEDPNCLIEDIKKINSVLANTGKKCIAFFDDTYCEGSYYIFKIDSESDNEIYTDQQIERLI